MLIMVIVKSVYGQSKIYPANDAAHALAEIAGTKTLAPSVLRVAKQKLGASVMTLSEDLAILNKMLEVA